MVIARDFSIILLSILLEAIPFLLIGVVVSAVLSVYVSDDFVVKWFPAKSLAGLFYALVMGFLFPVCECGNIPVARRLLIKGVEPAPVVTFLLAAPVLNPLVIIVTVAAFPGQPEILILRLVFTVMISLAVGAILFKVKKEDIVLPFETITGDGGCHGEEDGDSVSHKHVCVRHEHYRGLDGRRRFMEFLFLIRDEFFMMLRLLVLGTIIAASFRTIFPQNLVTSLGSGQVVSILTMMLLAFLVSMCSNVDAFFAMAFAGTFTAGSIVTFLVFGPMVDIKALVMMTSAFRMKAIIWISVLVALMSFLLGLLANYMIL
ncbi:MAG: permease [Actinobacteria bacterium]|nr:permease [Actinomycetota bacterium]MBU4240868.1 permease [Actinomycetota bacterium]MBU4301133.1 permease [Actinomycetota bacterium]MBU4490092.1 permease [Actinomycetota bacterium]